MALRVTACHLNYHCTDFPIKSSTTARRSVCTTSSAVAPC